jgi:hypothetical protein
MATINHTSIAVIIENALANDIFENKIYRTNILLSLLNSTFFYEELINQIFFILETLLDFFYSWPIRNYSCCSTLLSVYCSLASVSVQLCCAQLSSRSGHQNPKPGDWYRLTYRSNSPLRPWSRPRAAPWLVVGDYRSRTTGIFRRFNRIEEDRRISQLSSQ